MFGSASTCSGPAIASASCSGRAWRRNSHSSSGSMGGASPGSPRTLTLSSGHSTSESDHLVATTEHLMGGGLRAVHGYTQSDEISLLFHPDEDSFSRQERKYNSILASEGAP